MTNPTFFIYVWGFSADYLVSHLFFKGHLWTKHAVAQIAMSGDWGKAQAPDRLAHDGQIGLILTPIGIGMVFTKAGELRLNWIE